MAGVVAIVGAGASGTLTALHVVAAAEAAERATRIELYEPQRVGEGLAYSTRDPRHRLNVPAKGMSAYPADPGHFVRWLRRHVAVDYPEGGFAPRLHYAEYLEHCLTMALAHARYATLEQRAHRVLDVRRHGRRLRVTLDDGGTRPADAAVLATGHGSPSTTWAPEALRRSHRFLADPWRASQSVAVRPGESIVLVGAGLTMADMAQRWGRAGVDLHVVSRHGLLPLPHAAVPAPPQPAPDLSGGEALTLAAARRLVFAQIRAAGGDWRRGIDGLRPCSTDIWRRMDPEARAAFLRTAARRWDRVRHRVDPALDAWLRGRVDDGSLDVHAGSVIAAQETARGVRVELSDGSVLDAALVLNCTGTCAPVQLDEDPLVLNLLDSRLATTGALDLGFATDRYGRLVPADGAAPAAIWAIGPLRRGELWESTAIPEIRSQAALLAQQIVASLPARDLRRRPRDPYGQPISANPAAAAAYVDGLGRILRVQSGAAERIGAAVRLDPGFALGHAALALLGSEWGADVDVSGALAAARRTTTAADERERRFVEVVAERVAEPGAASAAALLSYLNTYPEDALAVSAAVPTIAFAGATELPAEAWALVDGLAPAYGEDWWYHGLLAFFRQEQGRYDEAAELADRALAIEPDAGHAVHARTHVYYETGAHRAGLAWLDRWIADRAARSAHPAHFSWHAALHELALGDDHAAGRRYRAQLSPPTVTGVRALVDSAALLWRGVVAQAWDRVDARAVLAVVPEQLLSAPPTPFVALHAAVALAAVGDCAGLARLRRYARHAPGRAFPRTIAPLCAALIDLVHDDPEGATEALLELRGVEHLGGSAAQREIVEDTLIHAATRAGRADVARDRLLTRLDRRPSPRDERRCAELV